MKTDQVTNQDTDVQRMASWRVLLWWSYGKCRSKRGFRTRHAPPQMECQRRLKIPHFVG